MYLSPAVGGVNKPISGVNEKITQTKTVHWHPHTTMYFLL